MKLVKLDINKHNLMKVTELIHETDSDTLNFYFKTKEKAVERIKKLLKAGNNSWGHENIYIVTGDNNQIFGVLVAYRGDKWAMKSDFKAYFKNLNLLDALKFTLLDIGYLMAGADLDKDDYYLSDVAVDEKCRGKGIGTFILDGAKELAKEKGCKRVVLDVDLENEGALRLYKRAGFKIFNKKSFKWFDGEKGFFNMEYII